MIMFVIGIFIMKRPKPFAGTLLTLRICTLNFTGLMVSEYCDVGEHMGF